MLLTDKVRVEQATDDLEPEDYFSESLNIFPDETRNIHGDPGSTVIYTSSRFGDIRMSVADPSGEDERRLFAHYVWNASIMLAELISSGHDVWRVEGEHVLELGSGLGLAGIVAALCGAKSVCVACDNYLQNELLAQKTALQVVLSDYPSEAILKNIQSNIKRNLSLPLQAATDVQGHVWGELSEGFCVDSKARFTRILAADCFWMPWQHDNLVTSMLHFLSDQSSARIFVVGGFHTGRAKLAPFFDVAVSKGLEIVQIYEIDVEGQTRSWEKERDGGREDVTGRKRWMEDIDSKTKWSINFRDCEKTGRRLMSYRLVVAELRRQHV